MNNNNNNNNCSSKNKNKEINRVKEVEKIGEIPASQGRSYSNMGGIKKLVIVPVVIGALGVVRKNFEKYVKKHDIEFGWKISNLSKHYQVYHS